MKPETLARVMPGQIKDTKARPDQGQARLRQTSLEQTGLTEVKKKMSQ